MTATPVKKEFIKPYVTDCCAKPDLWKYSDSEIRCRVCGENWTEEVQE